MEKLYNLWHNKMNKAFSVFSFLLLWSCNLAQEEIACKHEDENINFEIYKGENRSYDYLRQYILEYAVVNYEVDSNFFDTPTTINTDILREIVHYVNYKNKAAGRRPDKKIYNTLGYMFKDSVGENCGFMGTTLFDIYKSFGYHVKRYDVLDGNLNGFLKYRDSHVFVEVYIPGLKKYIIQDPTFNNSLISCNTNQRLSFEEVRKQLYMDDVQPCFLDNKVSDKMSPIGKLSARQKISVLEDYYTGTVLSAKKFEGLDDSMIQLHDMGKIANENKRSKNREDIEKRCNECKSSDVSLNENIEIKDFMACINKKILAHVIVTRSFDQKEKGFLIQYTNEKGENVLYDPFHNWHLGKSYFTYAYWDLNNRGFLLARDFKYTVPLKFYSYRKNEVLDF